MKTKHDKNCMVNCEEDLSGLCDCGYVINHIRCGNCCTIYTYRAPQKPSCPRCNNGDQE